MILKHNALTYSVFHHPLCKEMFHHINSKPPLMDASLSQSHVSCHWALGKRDQQPTHYVPSPWSCREQWESDEVTAQSFFSKLDKLLLLIGFEGLLWRNDCNGPQEKADCCHLSRLVWRPLTRAHTTSLSASYGRHGFEGWIWRVTEEWSTSPKTSWESWGCSSWRKRWLLEDLSVVFQ